MNTRKFCGSGKLAGPARIAARTNPSWATSHSRRRRLGARACVFTCVAVCVASDWKSQKERAMAAPLNIRDIGQDRKAAIEAEAAAAGTSISDLVRDWIDAGITRAPCGARARRMDRGGKQGLAEEAPPSGAERAEPCAVQAVLGDALMTQAAIHRLRDATSSSAAFRPILASRRLISCALRLSRAPNGAQLSRNCTSSSISTVSRMSF